MTGFPQNFFHGINASLFSLLNDWPLAIVGLDRDGKIFLWNQAAQKILGWSSEETLGEPATAILGRANFPMYRHFKRVINGQALSRKEHRQKTKSGKVVDISWSATPLRATSCKPEGVLIIIEDITSRKQLKQALIESERFARFSGDRYGRSTYR